MSSIQIMQHQFPLKAVTQLLPPAPLLVLHKEPSISHGNFACCWNKYLPCQRLMLRVTHPYIVISFITLCFVYKIYLNICRFSIFECLSCQWHRPQNLLRFQQWRQQLFLLLCCRKHGASPAGPQVYIKKPPNAFMLFLKEQRPLVRPELKTTGSKAVLTHLGTMVSVYLIFLLILRSRMGLLEQHIWVFPWIMEVNCMSTVEVSAKPPKREILQRGREAKTSSQRAEPRLVH